MNSKRKRITYKQTHVTTLATSSYASLDNWYTAFIHFEETPCSILIVNKREVIFKAPAKSIEEAKKLIRTKLLELGCAIGQEVRKGIVMKDGELQVK